MYIRSSLRVISLALLTCALPLLPSRVDAEDFGGPPDLSVLPPEKWDEIDASVEQALDFLASRQEENGSIPTYISGHPGVTSLTVLAFLSHGEQPGEGERGKVIERAINYALSCQREDDMFVVDSTMMPATEFERGSHTGLYNHAITCLMLCEAYGMSSAEQEPKIRDAIQRGIKFARKMQERPQRFPEDQGGFRYFKSVNGWMGTGDADLSVTGWFVMFFRSAKNAGFDVPQEYMDDAMQFVHKCYDPRQHAFYYGLNGHAHVTVARGMTGAGIMCLCAAGKPDPEILRGAGDWILRRPFRVYGQPDGYFDRFHYGAYYCSQAMLLLGGEYWSKFYPTLADTLIENQNEDGSWPAEDKFNDGRFGPEYTTALSVLTLTSPFQLLPIHQR